MMHRAITCLGLSFLVAGLVLSPVRCPAQDGTVKIDDGEKIYTVNKGDTLWHISERFLEDPFKWPVLWKRNPYIRNPHLIYPGDIVRITPDGIEVVRKGAVGIGGPPTDLPVERLKTSEAPEQLAALPKEQKPAPEPAEIITVSAPLMEKTGFITKDDYRASGVIVKPKEDKMFMAENDYVFITFEEGTIVNTGDRFTIIGKTDTVVHPVSGEEIGFLTAVLGGLRVTAVGEIVEALIDSSYKEIKVGDRLIPFEEAVKEVVVKESGKSVEGVIIATTGKKMNVAKYDIVYVDKGSNDTLEAGNIMKIYREMGKVQDPLADDRDITLPTMDLGTAVVLDVKDTTATAFIIDSGRPIRRGDLVRTSVE